MADEKVFGVVTGMVWPNFVAPTDREWLEVPEKVWVTITAIDQKKHTFLLGEHMDPNMDQLTCHPALGDWIAVPGGDGLDWRHSSPQEALEQGTLIELLRILNTSVTRTIKAIENKLSVGEDQLDDIIELAKRAAAICK